VAKRVFIHLGLPKTATTYLQTIVWGSRDRLRADGVLLPGDERGWSARSPT
jgi:superfamily II DNA helicase RecQ